MDLKFGRLGEFGATTNSYGVGVAGRGEAAARDIGLGRRGVGAASALRVRWTGVGRI